MTLRLPRGWGSPDIETISTHGCSKVVNPTHRPTLPPSIRGWVEPQGHSEFGRNMSLKNANRTIGNWTLDLPPCSAVPSTNCATSSVPKMWRRRPQNVSKRFTKVLNYTHTHTHTVNGNTAYQTWEQTGVCSCFIKWGSDPSRNVKFVSCPKCPAGLWSPSSFL